MALQIASNQQDWNQKLWQACQSGDLAAVNDALGKGADINWKNPDYQNYSPVHIATLFEREKVVEKLLNRKANPNTISEESCTPLMTACENGFKTLVELLLENGADPDLEGTDEGALHVAVQNNHKEVVDLLLGSGAVIDKRNTVGETPLHTAAMNGNAAIVRFLINKKAGVGKKNKGYTALHYATLHNSPKVVQLLLENGADPNTFTENGYSPLISAAKIGSKEIIQLLLQWSSSDGERIDVSNAAGNDGNTALHIASDQAQVEAVKVLVKEGNVDKLNEDGDTPLHLACRKGHSHVVQILLSYGAKQSIKNKEGKTPKELASDHNHTLTESMLNKTRAQLSKLRSFKQEDPQPQSVDEKLWRACQENKVDEISKLLADGANPNWRNKQENSFSCLDIAVFNDHTGVEKILLQNADQAKSSALHLAASYGHVEAAGSLIDAGADVNTLLDNMQTGDTPLHKAATYGHLETVKLLVQKRASLEIKNHEGLTPLDVAKKKRRLDVMKFLEENDDGELISLSTKTEHDAVKAEEEKKELEEKLKIIEAEKERTISVMKKEIAELNDELKEKREKFSALLYELEQKDRELKTMREKAINTPATPDKPEFQELICLYVDGGRDSLRIMAAITSHSEGKCADFAHVLLKDRVKVSGLKDKYKQDKEQFVRGVLDDWIATPDRSWQDLIKAMEHAAMDGEIVNKMKKYKM